MINTAISLTSCELGNPIRSITFLSHDNKTETGDSRKVSVLGNCDPTKKVPYAVAGDWLCFNEWLPPSSIVSYRPLSRRQLHRGERPSEGNALDRVQLHYYYYRSQLTSTHAGCSILPLKLLAHSISVYTPLC